MDNAVEVVVESVQWSGIHLDQIADDAFTAIAAKLNLVDGPYELSILACDDARIAVLNAEFRGKEAPTNVLSWPSFALQSETEGQNPVKPPAAGFGDPFVNIGDIAIAFETCMQEAKTAGLEPVHHITHLLIHGMLHLLGYDHEMDADAEVMEKLEIDLLDSMGIGNPYKDV